MTEKGKELLVAWMDIYGDWDEFYAFVGEKGYAKEEIL